jgi:ankyrin repeat protein
MYCLRNTLPCGKLFEELIKTKNNKELFELMREHPGLLNSIDECGNTPLHHAAFTNNEELASFCMFRGAICNFKNVLGNTPLNIAIINNHFRIAQLLLKQNSDVEWGENNDGFTPLHLLCGLRLSNCELRQFFKYFNDVDIKNMFGKTPLHYAVANCNKKATKFLISRGANLNAVCDKGMTPLSQAVERNDIQLATLLVRNGAVVDSLNFVRSDAMLSFLVRFGAFVNKTDMDGNTALHIAAIHRDVFAIDVLLRNGVDVKIKNNFGMTALHILTSWASIKVLGLIVQLGADVKDMDNYGLSPLFIAHYYCRWDVVTLFYSLCMS